MDRNSQLEIRRRSAVMAPPGSSLSVAREDLLEDLDELLALRRAAAPDESAFRRHPSGGGGDGRVRLRWPVPLSEQARR
ncbi:MAG: hypothetical protein ACYCR4_13520 [Acidimicrobiales bacterium]